LKVEEKREAKSESGKRRTYTEAAENTEFTEESGEEKRDCNTEVTEIGTQRAQR